MHRSLLLLQHPQRLRIPIASEQSSLHRSQKPAQRRKRSIYCRSLIPAVYHAIRASRIPRLRPVIRPGGSLHQLRKSLRVPILQKITRLLPPKNVVSRHAPRSARISPLSHQKLKKKRRQIKPPTLLAIRQDRAKHPPRPRPPQKMLLIRSLVVRVPRRKHHALKPKLHHLVEKPPHRFRIRPVKQSGIRGNPEAAPQRLFNRIQRNVVPTLAANRKVVFLALSIKVNAEGQIFAGPEKMNFLLQQQRIRAQINVFPPRHQPLNNLRNLRMHQRFAARNRNHGRAALLNRAKTLLRRKIFFQNVRRILNLPATRASQIAAEQRLQHEYQWVLLATGELLPKHVGRNGPHLGYGYWHV